MTPLFRKSRTYTALLIALSLTACASHNNQNVSNNTSQQALDSDTLLNKAIDENLDPTLLFPATASGTENSVTPLIHSAGIVIYGQEEDSSTDVKFRKVGASSWQDGFEFAWEPIYSALSGSLVHLDPDTDYEVEVTITDAYGDENVYDFDFTTQPNSPVINPNKVYYLSDIYNGGQLDLEALGIEGDENGYAKIIGDGQTIEIGDEHLAAVNIGSQAYVMLENLTIKGGQRYGIFAEKTHHIWIKGCDISGYGRVPAVYKNGRGYSSETSTSPINYDSGIYLEKSGIAVVEECEIHDPNSGANHWGYGHPNGPNALQVYAYHPDEQYRGQMIVRNNRFYGTDTVRFNDVIEGRKNTWRNGGFVRDSAIYNNYLAYANDDLIEIDGGQRNVLVYNNEITQGYAGISVAPNRLGPSYVFHNHIHDLGDSRGKEWTAIKAGGLISQPGGKTYLIENYINTPRNGLAASNVSNDSTFWIQAINNVVINHNLNNMVGMGIYDSKKYEGSLFENNIFYNKRAAGPNLIIDYNSLIPHPLTESAELANSYDEASSSVLLPVSSDYVLNNFSFTTSGESGPSYISMEQSDVSNFSDQTKFGSATVNDTSITLTGNIWKKISIPSYTDESTTLSFDIQIDGDMEIAGVALTKDNSLDPSQTLSFAGSQDYGIDLSDMVVGNQLTSVSIKLSDYNLTDANYLVFVLDNDISSSQSNSYVHFDNISFSESAQGNNGKITFSQSSLSNFSNQTKYGTATVENDDSIVMSGNIWKKIPFREDITEETVLTFEFKAEGDFEIAGLALETNNTLTESKVFNLAGSQTYGNYLNFTPESNGFTEVSIKLSDYGIVDASYLVFVLDDDIAQSQSNNLVEFKNIRISSQQSVSVGINN
jgi:hypothetical protein